MESSAAWLGSPHQHPALSTSLTGPSPPQINRPLDFCSRHIMSATSHPKLPGFLFSAHVDSPPVGVLSAKGLDLTQTALGQEHEGRALGRGATPFPPSPGTQGPPGPAETWSPRRASECLQARRGSAVEDFLPSSTAAHRLGDRLGPPRHLLAPRPPPGHPKEGSALQMPPVPGSLCSSGPRRRGQERSRDCIWCGW